MATHMFTTTLLACAIISTAVPLGSASALASAKAKKAPEGYHLDGFRGWSEGYRIGYPASDARRLIRFL